MKYVLVIIGKRTQERQAIELFKAAHLSADDEFVKILIGPDRLEQEAPVESTEKVDPGEWLVRTPENWRLQGEGAVSSLETYIRRRMKGGEVEVHFVNLDSDTRRQQAISQEMAGLGWRPFRMKAPTCA